MKHKTDNMADVSFISEEELLTAIFCACDIEHTGKVAVSRIVDYLRHTTSRGSGDTGLEELCNLLDPHQEDVSMDLETFHAIMKKWIEDCRRKWEDGATEEPTGSLEDLEFKVHKKATEEIEMYVHVNVASGSLEAIGGDVSKGDLETSDLVSCVADLQYKNRKLQEENKKLKLTLEAADEANTKLLADNEDLCHQIKRVKRSVLKAKSLEEELEEAKTNLNMSEEKRQQILCQNKQLEKENQSLISQMTSLQEEIIRNTLDISGFEEKILEVSENAAELQIQTHIYEKTVVSKEARLIQKEQTIKELKLTIAECSSVIETLRAEKTQLLENVQHMQQELILNGLSFPSLCKCNSIPEGTNSLHHELELAQSSEITRTEWTSLDETLDREVLVLPQGPDYAGDKFKTIVQNLQEEDSELEELVKTCLQCVKGPDVNMQQAWERKFVQSHCSKQLWSKEPTLCSLLPRTLHLDTSCWHNMPLLDALNLETSFPNNTPVHGWDWPCRHRSSSWTFESCSLSPPSTSAMTPVGCRWKICSAGNSTDADLPASSTMLDSSLPEAQLHELDGEECSDKFHSRSSTWYNFMSSWLSHYKTSFSNTNKTFWVSISILVLLAALTSFFTGLSLQRPPDTTPVGPGDSWTLVQQLLWPRIRLQHHRLPPL